MGSTTYDNAIKGKIFRLKVNCLKVVIIKKDLTFTYYQIYR